MSKLTLTDVSNISGAETSAIAAINSNNDALEAALENTLSRDGTAPNAMNNDFDMNGYNILNAGQVQAESLLIDGVLVTVEGQGIQSVQAGSGISVDASDAANPVISTTGGVTDGDKGDVVVSSSGTVWTLDSSVVTAAAKTVLDDTSTSAMLVTLGAGTVATQNANAVAITGGTITGLTSLGVSGPVSISAGGTPQLYIKDYTAAPPQYQTIGNSLGTGPIYVDYIRTGGYGAYGNFLLSSHATSAVSSGQGDINLTAWQSHTNLTGGTVMGAWLGANTPSSYLSQTFSSGNAVGLEVNVGNRWGDLGLQSDVGGSKYTVGIQVVPDVIPARDGDPNSSFYPGNFGIVTSASVWGHTWWVGSLSRTDAINPGGYARLTNGGSIVGKAPLALEKSTGYFVKGLDYSGATFSGNVLDLPNMQLNANGALNLGTSGATKGRLFLSGDTSGQLVLQPSSAAAGTLTLPAATDTLVGKATTDILTNKTFDTAGTGNVFKINGTTISDKTGTGKAVLDTSPTLVTPVLGAAAATSISLSGSTTPITSVGLDANNSNNLFFANGAGNFPLVGFKSSAGTNASPTARQSGEVIGAFNFWGYGATGYSVTANALVRAVAEENFTDSAMGTSLRFESTAIGSATRSERMRVKEGVYHPSATGGDKGNNTVNFGTIYQGGVAFSPPGAPVTKTADFTIAVTEQWLINNKTGSTCTATLPAAASFTGRVINITNWQAQTVVSASSNVVPRAGGSAGTAILAATAGAWAKMVSDGTNWLIVEGS